MYRIDTPPIERRRTTWKITDLQIGDTLSTDHITSHVFLSHLIEVYNERYAKDPAQQFNLGILDAQRARARPDSRAHYCGIPVLTRFGKPDKDGIIEVIERKEMTLDWLNEQIGRVEQAARLLRARINAEGKRGMG